MAKIHPLAVVSPEAELGLDVVVGPFCIIEAGARIGEGTTIASHAVVKSGVEMGKNNVICESAVIGGFAQHTKPPGPAGIVKIGEGNTFREATTVHRSLYQDKATLVGDNCYFMCNTHIAHDCVVENRVICANNAAIGGHVFIGESAFVSGNVGVHQWCRIGRLAMVGATARITRDVAPYTLIDGASNRVVGLNVVGVRRAGHSASELQQLKAAYRFIFRSGMLWTEILAKLPSEFPTGPASIYADFLKATKRGLTPERRSPHTATVKLPAEGETDMPVESDRKLRVRAS